MEPYDKRPHLPLHQEIGIVVPASLIPSGARVRKLKTATEYKLVRQIRVYPERQADAQRQTLVGNDCVFLQRDNDQSDHAAIRAYPASHKFVWLTTLNDLSLQLQHQGRLPRK